MVIKNPDDNAKRFYLAGLNICSAYGIIKLSKDIVHTFETHGEEWNVMFTLMDYENDTEYLANELNGKYTAEDLEDMETRSAPNYKRDNPLNLYCSCKKPQKIPGLQYSIFKNKKGTYYARPRKNNGGIDHDCNCIKHPENQEYRRLNPAYKEADNNSDAKIETRINFSKKPRRQHQMPCERANRRTPFTDDERTGCIRSAYELFNFLNERFWQISIVCGHEEVIDGKTYLCKNPYWNYLEFEKKLMSYKIDLGKFPGPMNNYTLEEHGFAFLYGKVIKIRDVALHWGKPNAYVQIQVENYDKSSDWYKIPVWFYEILSSKFSGHYENRTMEYDNTSYSLVLAGSYEIDAEDGRKNFLKGTFLMVSPKYGIASESIHEARFYDMAMDVLQRDDSIEKMYKKVAFYKPNLFLPAGIYSGKGLPDGILESRAAGRKCVIEIYGSQDPTYLKRRSEKEEWLDNHSEYDYFYWDVCDKKMSFDQVTEEFRKLVRRYYSNNKADDKMP